MAEHIDYVFILQAHTPELNTANCRLDSSKELKELFSRVLGNYNKIIKTADVLQIMKPLLQYQESSLHLAFLQKLLMVNYTARYISADIQTGEEDDVSPEPVANDQGDSM